MTNGLLKSAKQSQRELNALVDESELLYSILVASSQRAITELLRAKEVAYKMHALEQYLALNRDRLMTPGQAVELPSTRRQMHSCTLIELISQELRSIAQTNPVEAVEGLSRAPESIG